jgi:hypothetical protein
MTRRFCFAALFAVAVAAPGLLAQDAPGFHAVQEEPDAEAGPAVA